MKNLFTLIREKFIFLLLFAFSISITAVSKNNFNFLPHGHTSCFEATQMDCTDNFIQTRFETPVANSHFHLETCLGSFPDTSFREFWVSLHLSGGAVYYLDAYGANAGVEIYSGTCEDDLTLERCEPPTDNNSYIEFISNVEVSYFVRILANIPVEEPDSLYVSINCTDPAPSCTATIDDVLVAHCINDDGEIDVTVSGFVSVVPDIPEVYLEILTDSGFYVFSGVCSDHYFEIPVEITGTQIQNILVYIGNSESGCGASTTGILLPDEHCNTITTTTFKGMIDWNNNCFTRLANVKFYLPGTNEMQHVADVDIPKSGKIDVELVPLGNYDIYLTIPGYLTKRFANVAIIETEDVYDFDNLVQGDLNGDNMINPIDWSIMSGYFFTPIPLDSPERHYDQNCDGWINIVDFSFLMQNMNQAGDAPFSAMARKQR